MFSPCLAVVTVKGERTMGAVLFSSIHIMPRVMMFEVTLTPSTVIVA